MKRIMIIWFEFFFSLSPKWSLKNKTVNEWIEMFVSVEKNKLPIYIHWKKSIDGESFSRSLVLFCFTFRFNTSIDRSINVPIVYFARRYQRPKEKITNNDHTGHAQGWTIFSLLLLLLTIIFFIEKKFNWKSKIDYYAKKRRRKKLRFTFCLIRFLSNYHYYRLQFFK